MTAANLDDGAAMAAVVFRDHQGKILDGDVKRVHVKSVLQGELAAGHPFGLCHGQRGRFLNVSFESDSKQMIHLSVSVKSHIST